MADYHVYFAACHPTGGIYHYLLRDGEMEFREKMPCDRPMYLDIEGDILRVVLRAPFAEGNHSALQCFPIASDGKLGTGSPLTDTRGVCGCHLCHFHGNVYVTNYLSGNVFGTNGTLDVHEGRGTNPVQGTNPVRQDMPHTHCIVPSPDLKYMLSCDLGLDSIFVYDDQLQRISVAHVPEGHGARHLAFSEDGKYVFCVNELASTVTVFRWNTNTGSLTPLATVESLYKPNPDSTAAAIRVRGNHVYVSQRGEDAISVLTWENEEEELHLEQVVPCGGQSPRDFLLVEDTLLCANEKTDAVSVHRMDGAIPRDTSLRLSMPNPLCVVALPC